MRFRGSCGHRGGSGQDREVRVAAGAGLRAAEIDRAAGVHFLVPRGSDDKLRLGRRGRGSAWPREKRAGDTEGRSSERRKLLLRAFQRSSCQRHRARPAQ